LISFHENGTNVSLLTVETYLCMGFICLGVFLSRYYCKMVFWAHFGPQNRDFRVLPAHKFDIIS